MISHLFVTSSDNLTEKTDDMNTICHFSMNNVRWHIN
jgi:hypothetical protein